MILKLMQMTKSIDGEYVPTWPIWVNVDHIRRFWAAGGTGAGSCIELTGMDHEDTPYLRVAEDPDELAALIDPENACPNGGPSKCGYHAYLGAGDGSADLSHAGWHASTRGAERHMQDCTKWTNGHVCETCLRYEQRLRA